MVLSKRVQQLMSEEHRQVFIVMAETYYTTFVKHYIDENPSPRMELPVDVLEEYAAEAYKAAQVFLDCTDVKSAEWQAEIDAETGNGGPLATGPPSQLRDDGFEPFVRRPGHERVMEMIGGAHVQDTDTDIPVEALSDERLRSERQHGGSVGDGSSHAAGHKW